MATFCIGPLLSFWRKVEQAMSEYWKYKSRDWLEMINISR